MTAEPVDRPWHQRRSKPMRRTPMNRGGKPKQPKDRSKVKARGGFTTRARKMMLERDRGRCVRCGSDALGFWAGHSWQHRDNRGTGGTRDPRRGLPCNGVLLCGSATTGCHGWVENHPELAAWAGWVVMAGEDPADVPVLYAAWGRVCALDEKGGRTVLAGVEPGQLEGLDVDIRVYAVAA